MEILREVECSVRKGLGPEWIDKVVTVFLDDIEDWVSESEIHDMVVWDAKSQLKQSGYEAYIIKEVNTA